MNELIVREYLGRSIEFKMVDGMVYANANNMTDGDTLKNWKRSPNTKRYIEALENSQSVKSTQWIISKKGGNELNETGTWIHEKLVLSLARYISIEFELWCDEQIATLIREGSVSLKKDDKASILLAIYNGGIDAVEASRRLTAIEIKPLKDKIKQDEPLVELAKKRLDKNGLISITEANATFNLKRGRITKWAKREGYLHKTKAEVNKAGLEYFKVYDSSGYKCIGVTENGLTFINKNIETI